MRSIFSTPHRLRLCFARLLGDRAGATVVIIALALSAIVGFAGLGTETASWYFIKRSMQGAADSAAATAAAELATNSSTTSSQMTSAARSIASTFGFVNGTGSTTVTVNNPPASGGYDSTLSRSSSASRRRRSCRRCSCRVARPSRPARWRTPTNKRPTTAASWR